MDINYHKYAKDLCDFVCVPSHRTCNKRPRILIKNVVKTNNTKSENWRHNIPEYLIKTGEISGIIVLDIDNPKDDELSGMDFLDELKKLNWKDTTTVNTPRKGLHYYFKYDDGVTMNQTRINVFLNEEDIPDKYKLVSIDIINNAGLICGPHSIYKTDKTDPESIKAQGKQYIMTRDFSEMSSVLT